MMLLRRGGGIGSSRAFILSVVLFGNASPVADVERVVRFPQTFTFKPFAVDFRQQLDASPPGFARIVRGTVIVGVFCAFV